MQFPPDSFMKIWQQLYCRATNAGSDQSS